MEFLNPLFLLAAGAVAVPILLHLLHRRVGRRRAFPALRYLQRTEREHASRIRLRQLLLLLLRAAAILLLVLAGARLVVRGLGSEHEPTALALVVDNSMSTGAVVGEARVLDRLRDAALASVEEAGPDDRIWVIPAAEPWHTPVPGGAKGARRRIRELRATGGVADLVRAVEEARSLVADGGMPAAEVHVFTDLQATSWSASPAPAGEDGSTPADEAGTGPPPVLVYHPDVPELANRWISRIRIGGGLAPLVNQRTEVEVGVEGRAGPEGEASTEDTVRVRLNLDGRVVAAVDAPLGTATLVPVGPFPLGGVTGSAEIDPDALRADDRRHFAFRVRPPPRLAVTGDPGFFARQALQVLEDADRIRRADGSTPDVVVAPEGRGLEDREDGAAVVLLPPPDPALLPATNRRLREADVPWRLENDPGPGEIPLRVVDLPAGLSGVRVRRAYRLVPAGDPEGTVRVRRETGEPWLVTGRAGERPYLLLASPLVPEATSLPLTAEMLPVLEWMVSGWTPAIGEASPGVTGNALALPAGATGVRDPEGTLSPVDGTLPFRNTGRPGIYEILRGDSVLERVALNPPVRESRLERLDPSGLERRVAGPLRVESSPTEWSRSVFLSRRGGEVWRPLLLAALLLLVVESLIAAGGSGRERASPARYGGDDSRPEATTRKNEPDG